jgi:hypothetical protein
MGRDHAPDVVFVGQVGGDLLDLVAGSAQLLDRLRELFGPARRDGQRVAVLAQRVSDGEPDPARGSGDERGAVWHGAGVLSVGDPLSNQGCACRSR